MNDQASIVESPAGAGIGWLWMTGLVLWEALRGLGRGC